MSFDKPQKFGRQHQPSDIEKAAEKHFQHLNRSETLILRAAVAGEVAVCNPTDRPIDTTELLTFNHHVRATLLRWLCTSREAQSYVDPQGLRIHSAVISDDLDLTFVECPFALSFMRCVFRESMFLISATAPYLDFRGTSIERLTADGISVRGSVNLGNGFQARSGIRFVDANIGGDFDCSTSRLGNSRSDRIAISAEQMRVKGGMFFRDALVERYG